MASTYQRQTELPLTPEELFVWHERPGAFQRLVPPWETVEVESHPAKLVDGERVHLRVSQGPLKLRWVSEIYDVKPGRQFCDRQLKGPFAKWNHRHGFDPAPDGRSILNDQVKYSLPTGALADVVAGWHVRQTLDRMFTYRHRIMKNDLELQQRYPMEPMKVLVTGSTGLIGRHFVNFLRTAGHEVIRAVRKKSDEGADTIAWNPQKGFQGGAKALEGIDVVVHLAGRNIASGRWSDEVKRDLRESRVEPTRIIAETLAAMERKPRLFLCGAAMGIYSDTGDKAVDEAGELGTGFLPDLAKDWEEATAPAAKAGIRVVLPRTGIVLNPDGGALEKMLPIFKLGIGGRLGDGKAWFSWIAIDDMIGGFYHCMATESLSGPINFTAPNPVTNAEFTRTLARVLCRPVGPPAPKFALKLAFGEMAEATLLKSARVVPKRLTESGYQFLFPEVEPALRHVLGREK